MMATTPEDVAEHLADLSVGGGVASADVAHGGAGPRADAHASASADASAGAPSGADAASANQARPGSDSRKLFVGGLPQGSSEEQVTTVFAPHGKVEEVRHLATLARA